MAADPIRTCVTRACVLVVFVACGPAGRAVAATDPIRASCNSGTNVDPPSCGKVLEVFKFDLSTACGEVLGTDMSIHCRGMCDNCLVTETSTATTTPSITMTTATSTASSTASITHSSSASSTVTVTATTATSTASSTQSSTATYTGSSATSTASSTGSSTQTTTALELCNDRLDYSECYIVKEVLTCAGTFPNGDKVSARCPIACKSCQSTTVTTTDTSTVSSTLSNTATTATSTASSTVSSTASHTATTATTTDSSTVSSTARSTQSTTLSNTATSATSTGSSTGSSTASSTVISTVSSTASNTATTATSTVSTRIAEVLTCGTRQIPRAGGNVSLLTVPASVSDQDCKDLAETISEMIDSRCGRSPSGTPHLSCSIINRGGMSYRIMTSASCSSSTKALRTLAAAVVPLSLMGPRMHFVCEDSFLLVRVTQCERSIAALNTAIHYHSTGHTDDLNPNFDQCAEAITATSTQTTSATTTASTTESTIYLPLSVSFDHRGFLQAGYPDTAAAGHLHGCTHTAELLNKLILQCVETFSFKLSHENSGSGDADQLYDNKGRVTPPVLSNGTIFCAQADDRNKRFLMTNDCYRDAAIVSEIIRVALPRPHSGSLIRCTEHGQLQFTPAGNGLSTWSTRSELLGYSIHLFRQGELHNCDVTTPSTTGSSTRSSSASTTLTTSGSSTDTTSTTITQTTTPHCFGVPDQPDCEILGTSDCGFVRVGVNVSLACPAMCGVCDTITTTTPSPEPLATLGCVQFNTTNIVTAGEAQCTDLVATFTRITSKCFATNLTDKMECKSVFDGDRAVFYLGSGERCTRMVSGLNVALAALQRPANFQCVDGFLGIAQGCPEALNSVRLGAARLDSSTVSQIDVCVPGLDGRTTARFYFIEDDEFRAAASDGSLLEPLFIAGLETYLNELLGTFTDQLIVSDLTTATGAVTAAIADWPAKGGKVSLEVVGALKDLVTSTRKGKFMFSYNGHTLQTSVEVSAKPNPESDLASTAIAGASGSDSGSDDNRVSVLLILLLVLVLLALLTCAGIAIKRNAKRRSQVNSMLVAQQRDINSDQVTDVGMPKADDDAVITDTMSIPPASPPPKPARSKRGGRNVYATVPTDDMKNEDNELYETTAFSIGGSPQSKIGAIMPASGQATASSTSQGDNIEANSRLWGSGDAGNAHEPTTERHASVAMPHRDTKHVPEVKGQEAPGTDGDNSLLTSWRDLINATVVLNRADQKQGFGFGIKWDDGGAIVSIVASGGVADGQLAVGDKIISLNQQPLAGLPRETAKSTLAASITVELGIWSSQDELNIAPTRASEDHPGTPTMASGAALDLSIAGDEQGSSENTEQRKKTDDNQRAYDIATERIPAKVTADWVKVTPTAEQTLVAPDKADGAGAKDDGGKEKAWWKSEFSKRSSLFTQE